MYINRTICFNKEVQSRSGSQTLRRQVWIQCYTTTLSNFIKCQSDAAAAHSRHFCGALVRPC